MAVHYRGSREEAERTVLQAGERGAQACSFCAELGDPEQAESLVPQVVARFGRLDAVVNNASIFEYDEVGTLQDARLQHHLAINTRAPIVLTRALHAHLAQRGALGCAVNLLDQKLWNPNPDYLSYTVSKAGLQSATQALAMALAPTLRVCAVAPGLTLGSEFIDDATLQRLGRSSLLGHAVDPADVAHAVRFVLENRSMTGSTVMVDAGFQLVRSPRDLAFLDD